MQLYCKCSLHRIFIFVLNASLFKVTVFQYPIYSKSQSLQLLHLFRPRCTLTATAYGYIIFFLCGKNIQFSSFLHFFLYKDMESKISEMVKYRLYIKNYLISLRESFVARKTNGFYCNACLLMRNTA